MTEASASVCLLLATALTMKPVFSGHPSDPHSCPFKTGSNMLCKNSGISLLHTHYHIAVD